VLSKRLGWGAPENALARLAREREARGGLIDLTESNPTRVGLPYPEEALQAAFARAELARYAPSPLGVPAARAAVAAEYARGGTTVDAARVVLTASSSEAYGFLFKLLCDPGDALLVPEPSYPLFEYLARLESAVPVPYRLAFDGAWHVDRAALDGALESAGRAGTRPRALVVVNPNNPTGSFLKRDELALLAAVCAERDLGLISDEVFAPYPAAADPRRVATVAVASGIDALPIAAFSLGGLSKGCALPHLKLGWIVCGGGKAGEALDALELVADTYLSVSTPVQSALPDLFAVGAGLRAALATRVADNRARLAAALPDTATLLPAEGGWSAVVRVPAVRSDEAWAAALLDEAGVLVQPGYFFDLRGGTFLVLSLIPPPQTFAEGAARLRATLERGT
jgi:aspartate/methionine/tyrosine aminotransferase